MTKLEVLEFLGAMVSMDAYKSVDFVEGGLVGFPLSDDRSLKLTTTYGRTIGVNDAAVVTGRGLLVDDDRDVEGDDPKLPIIREDEAFLAIVPFKWIKRLDLVIHETPEDTTHTDSPHVL